METSEDHEGLEKGGVRLAEQILQEARERAEDESVSSTQRDAILAYVGRALIRGAPTRIRTAKDGISVREAAKQIGVSYQTLYAWIHRGDVPVTKFGPKGHIVRIDPDDLDALRH